MAGKAVFVASISPEGHSGVCYPRRPSVLASGTIFQLATPPRLATHTAATFLTARR